MKLPRDMDAASLIKVLAKLGYRQVRQSGSHVRLECEEPVHRITIPNHSPLRIGTPATILAEVAAQRAMTRDALVRLLFE